MITSPYVCSIVSIRSKNLKKKLDLIRSMQPSNVSLPHAFRGFTSLTFIVMLKGYATLYPIFIKYYPFCWCHQINLSNADLPKRGMWHKNPTA